jgi:heme-degrading monooxygenase HmoA
MIGVSVVFDYEGDFDRSRVIEVAKNAHKMFEGMPGLPFKVFTLDEKQQRAMNFYVWDSREAAEAFFTEQLRERVTGLYGASPTVSFLEIPASALSLSQQKLQAGQKSVILQLQRTLAISKYLVYHRHARVDIDTWEEDPRPRLQRMFG